MLDLLEKRGFIHNTTNRETLENVLSNPVTVYAGFDCTAPSLHVGNLLSLLLLKQFQPQHQVIAVIGTATTLIGDPSGKSTARPMIDVKTVESNAAGIEENIRAVLGDGVTILRNGDWIQDITYLSFLRDIGRHIPVNKMLALDSVKSRLETGISFLEFSYSLLQAFDHMTLTERFGPTIQVGGSDQYGNITMSCEVIRRVLGKEGYGITTPLLTNSKGEKMGKSVNGAVWLNEKLLSVDDFWHFWRNVDDQDVDRFLRLFEGDIPDAPINDRKIVLANSVTKLVHGDKGKGLEEKNRAIFSGDETAYPELPCVGMDIVSALIQSGKADSKSAARRLIDGKAVRFNGEIITETTFILREGILFVGKKARFLVK